MDQVDDSISVLEAQRWKTRPLVVVGPTLQASEYVEQVRRADEASQGMAERDMVLIQIVGDGGWLNGRAMTAWQVADLREAVEIGDDVFGVVLVGKDGGVKGRWDHGLLMQEVFALIDGMPMRRREMREGGGS